MFRFIGNFVLFGFIFFLLSHYFPDAFATLVGWVEAAWDFVVNVFQQLVDKFNETKS